LLKKTKDFKSGVAVDDARHMLYSLDIYNGAIAAIDLKDGTMTSGIVGGRPYDVAVGKGGHLLYVSDWSRRQILAVNPEDLRVVSRIPVGEHPNQLLLHPKDDRLFVACASSNHVAVVDTKRGIVT